MINNGWNRLEKISFAVFIVTLLVALFIFLLMEIINIRHADDVSTQPSKKGNYLAVNAPKQETSTSSNSGSFVLSSALLVAPEKAHVSNSLISMDASTNVAQTFPARHEDSISNNNLSHSINSPTNTVFDSSVQFALARESSNRENAMALEFSDETSLNDKSAQQSRLDSTQPFVSNVTVVATEDFADVPLLPAEIIINACWNTAVKPPSDDSVNVNFPGNNQLLAIPVWAATSIIVKGIEIIAWPIEKLREPKHARFDQEIFSNNYRNHKYKYPAKYLKLTKKITLSFLFLTANPKRAIRWSRVCPRRLTSLDLLSSLVYKWWFLEILLL